METQANAYDRAPKTSATSSSWSTSTRACPDQRLATPSTSAGLGLTRDPFLKTGR